MQWFTNLFYLKPLLAIYCLPMFFMISQIRVIGYVRQKLRVAALFYRLVVNRKCHAFWKVLLHFAAIITIVPLFCVLFPLSIEVSFVNQIMFPFPIITVLLGMNNQSLKNKVANKRNRRFKMNLMSFVGSSAILCIPILMWQITELGWEYYVIAYSIFVFFNLMYHAVEHVAVFLAKKELRQ